jgi:uncharacterized protein YllA (UPF0747 family)
VKRAEGASLARLDRVLDALRPRGDPQDRVHNPLPYLAKYGDAFLEEVERAVEVHWRRPSDE